MKQASANLILGKVYVFQMESTYWYKVGFTKGSVSDRMAKIQTGCPLPLELRYEFEGSTALESWFHRKWRLFKSNGGEEWLRLPQNAFEEAMRDLRLGAQVPLCELNSPMVFVDWLMEQRQRNDSVGDFAHDTYWAFSSKGKSPLPRIASIQEWTNFVSELNPNVQMAGAAALNEYLNDKKIFTAFRHTAWYKHAIKITRHLFAAWGV